MTRELKKWCFLLCRDGSYRAGRGFLMIGWRELPVHEGYVRKFKIGFSVSFALYPQPWICKVIEIPPRFRRWFRDTAYVVPTSWRWPVYFSNLSAYARKGECHDGPYTV